MSGDILDTLLAVGVLVAIGVSTIPILAIIAWMVRRDRIDLWMPWTLLVVYSLAQVVGIAALISYVVGWRS